MRKTRRLMVLAIVLATAALAGCFLFPNRPPVADFKALFGTDETKPLLVVFDASDSSDPDGDDIVAYMWTTDEPEDKITDITPQSTKTVYGPIISVEFKFSGDHVVTLAVRDEQDKVSVPVTTTVTVPHE